MSHPDDYAYFSRRMAVELERGGQATDLTAAAAHYDLAHRYGILAAGSARDTPPLEIIDGGKVNQQQLDGLDLAHQCVAG